MRNSCLTTDLDVGAFATHESLAGATVCAVGSVSERHFGSNVNRSIRRFLGVLCSHVLAMFNMPSDANRASASIPVVAIRASVNLLFLFRRWARISQIVVPLWKRAFYLCSGVIPFSLPLPKFGIKPSIASALSSGPAAFLQFDKQHIHSHPPVNRECLLGRVDVINFQIVPRSALSARSIFLEPLSLSFRFVFPHVGTSFFNGFGCHS